MKNNLKKILTLAIIFCILPLSLVLVGCGATAVNSAKGVSFVSDIKEDGKAVFELDFNSPLKLKYKINPSSAYGYAPRFTAIYGISGDHTGTYDLDDVTGEFLIHKKEFSNYNNGYVEVMVTVGSYTDVCKVRLKDYPTEIGLYDESVPGKINKTPKIKIACGESYQINVAGIMEDSQVALLKDSKFNFLIETDENSKTLIDIQNENRLNFVAYNNYGTAKVKVALCDYHGNVFKNSDGNAKFAFEIEVEVYKPCASIDLSIDGVKTLISSIKTNGTNPNQIPYELKLNSGLFNADKSRYELNFEGFFYDKDQRLIEDESLDVLLFVNKTTYITVDNDANKIYITIPPSSEPINVEVEVWSNATYEDGTSTLMNFNLKIIF